MIDVATAFSLSGAAGLNAWIPLLAAGLLDRAGQLHLAEPYDALATTPGLIVLGVFFVLDFVGDKVPAVDSLLHAVGSIVHPASGAILFAGSAETPTDIPSIVLFALGAVTAGSLHATRATVRPASTTLTAGAGNPVLSLGEDLSSFVLSVLGVLVPLVGVLLLLVMAVVAVLWWRRVTRRARLRARR